MPIKKTSLFPAVHITLEECEHCKWFSVCLVKDCFHVAHGTNVERATYHMQLHLYDVHGVDRTFSRKYLSGDWP